MDRRRCSCSRKPAYLGLSAAFRAEIPAAIAGAREGWQRAHWVIDGKIRGLFRFTFSKDDLVKKSKTIGREMTTDMATRDMADVAGRIKHMDELGIDTQVLYPSIFLDPCTERPDTEVALCGAYNGWLMSG